MIDAIIVADEGISDATQLQQAIPVRIVSRQARDLQSEYDSHVSQRNLTGEAREAGTFVDAGAGQAEVFVNYDHLRFGPAQLTGPLGQSVLASSGLTMMLH